MSHYLLARGARHVRLKEKDIKTVNTSDADIVAAFKAPTRRRWSPGIRSSWR